MKMLWSQIRSAVLVTLVLGGVCGGAYPVLVFGLSQLLFPRQANGSFITDGHEGVRGSRLIGQPFTSDKYFHSRPSAAGNGYDATSSGGSNLGPTSQKLRDSIAQNVSDYRTQNGLATNAPVPADAVTSSGSGLDPHISPENAALQSSRVAKARGLSRQQVQDLVSLHTRKADLGLLGEPGVNVLELNLALDALSSSLVSKSLARSP